MSLRLSGACCSQWNALWCVFRPWWLGWVVVGALGLAACAVPMGRRPQGEPPSRHVAARNVPASWLEALCDRVEDCAVQRNVQLADRYGGSPTDRALARAEAERAVVSGEVRRWCLMRLRDLDRAAFQRVRACLPQRSCSAFARCAHQARRASRSRAIARRSRSKSR